MDISESSPSKWFVRIMIPSFNIAILSTKYQVHFLKVGADSHPTKAQKGSLGFVFAREDGTVRVVFLLGW
jgi:hypothetical protein